MAGTIYKSITLLFKSIGLHAREALDRVAQFGYLNQNGCLEREENAMSSRYGNVIINRSPDPLNPVNYLLPAAPITLARLKALNGTTYRYAALSDGSLYRRATDIQGPYTQILPPGTLSGLPFTTIVVTMYESSTPYILLCDSKQMYKDNGTLPAPQQLGIFAPLLPALSAAYAPVVNILADFSQVSTTSVTDAVTNSTKTVTSATASFTSFDVGDYLYGTNIPAGATIASVTNSTTIVMSIAATGGGSGGTLTFTNYATGGGLTTSATGETFNTIDAGFYGPQLGGDHYAYTWGTLPPPVPMPVPDGALLQSSTTHQVGVKYDSDSFNQTFQYVTPSNTYAPSDTFSFDGATISIPSSSTGTFTYAFPAAINLSNYNPADLICIVMRVDTPQDVSSISLNFDVAGSNYTSSYYTKTIIPVSYQGFITDPLSTDAITALTDQVLLDSLTNSSSSSSSSSSSLTLSPSSSPSPSLFSIPIESIGPPTKYTSSLVSNSGVSSYGYVPSQLNPASLATNSAWSTIYLQKGDFLPVGNAGQPGLDWTVITGFQLAITTNTSGDTDVDLNTLYLQGDPTSNGVGTNAGPSSYAGVGYDIRYIFKNSSTGTPSNPSSQQLFSTTPLNPGAVSTLVVLRQAIDVVGQYTTDTQADLVQIFVRGGLYGDTWRYVDQFPNLPLSLPVENIAYISVITTLIGYEVVLTTQSVNVFQTGTPVTLNGLTTMPALNGQTLFVNSTPSPSQLEFAFISPPVADETITEISITDVAPHYPSSPQARYVILTLSAPNQYSVGTSIVLSGLTVFPQLNGYVALISELPSPSQILFAVGSPDSMSLPPTYPTTPETGLITPSAVPSAVSVSVETGTITPALNSFPGAGLFNYQYILPDTALQQGQILGLANDVPISSSLQIPVNTTLTTAITLPASPNINYPLYANVTVADPTTIFRVNQIVTVGTPANLEQTLVIVGGVGQFTAWFQLSHTVGEPVQAFSLPAQPVTLQAIAYNTNWWAGDINNPHYLYYANYGYPENSGPQQYIPCGTPSDPIVLVENRQGTLYVSTLSTWYKIFPGNPPYAQSTGSKHGAAASYGWGDAEGETFYSALDGIRTFRGSDGPYMSLPIEWLWRDNPLTPVELIDTSKLSKMLGAYNNNTATFVYIGQDEQPHRIIFDRSYNRWRNDDVPVTAMTLEADTNTLVYSKPITIPGTGSGWVIVYDSYSQDYDDGGWVNGALVQLPIPINLQTPYLDIGAPNNQKQFNVLTIDADPNGQVLTLTLLFDGMNGDPTSLPTIPPTFTGSGRDKFDFQINSGLGQQAYQISLQITGDVTAAPTLYQAELYAAVLADQRSSYDTYLITLGTNETKLVKQAFIDYTTDAGVSLNMSLYADGDTKPYFTFTLPPNTTRHKVPIRVRFPAKLLRLFRMVILGSGDGSGQFQLWSPVGLEFKQNSPASASGYKRVDLGDTTP